MDTHHHPLTSPSRAKQEPELWGHSPAILALRSAATRVANSPEPVFVHGQAGSGKTLTARWLHGQSRRAGGPFVAVHASALDAGSFDATRPGTGEPGLQALRGTLFISAIEELGEEAQAALLRVLDGGGEFPRLVTASCLDMDGLASGGHLRGSDLVYRICSLQLHVPALRDRPEDVPGLAARILAELAPGRPMRTTDAAATALVLHAWPGNVRELHNRLSQAVLMTDGNEIGPELLGLSTPDLPTSLSLRAMRQAAEREAITRALRQCRGQVPAAAVVLGISRAQLYRLISRLHLNHHAVLEASA